MRRLTLFAALALLFAPAAVEAQPRLMAGAGLSTGIGDFGDAVKAGWHGTVGMQLGVPAFPLAARAEGGVHRFGALDILGVENKTSMLSGALSAVYTLPGVGVAPYLLAGLGVYRTTVEVGGLSGSDSNSGFHGAFGVNLGALGFGGFAEVRIIQIQTDPSSSRFVMATVGIRL